MDIIINILLPVFGIAAAGYLAARSGYFPDSANEGVSVFVFNFAVPAMLLRTVAETELPTEIPWGLFAGYYLPAAMLYLLGLGLARFMFRRDGCGQVVTGMGFAFGNSILLGLPLVLTAYGEDRALPYLLLLSVHGLTYFTVTTLLLELARPRQGGAVAVVMDIARALVSNPILLALAAGILLNLSGLGLADPVERLCRMMQGAAAPAALFVLGASLVRYGIAGRISQSLILVSAKIILFPAMVFVLCAHVLGLPPLWVQMATLLAAQPVGVMVFVYAERYGSGQALAATSIFLSSIASMFTLWAILHLFDV